MPEEDLRSQRWTSYGRDIRTQRGVSVRQSGKFVGRVESVEVAVHLVTLQNLFVQTREALHDDAPTDS